MAQVTDFRQGDTKKIKIDYGTAVNITGYKFWFSMRVDFDAELIAQVETTAGSHASDDAINGIAYIELGSDVTKNIPAGKYVWDIQRVVAGNPPDVLTIAPSTEDAKEKITVFSDVTELDV